MSNKTDRGPPPPLRRPDQSAARGGPRPSWPCRVAPQLAAPDPDFGWPPGGQCGSHWGWPRCDAVLGRRVGGPRAPLDWTQERGACDGIVDAGARAHEGWSAVVGSSLEERTDKASFFPFLVPVFLSSCFFL